MVEDLTVKASAIVFLHIHNTKFLIPFIYVLMLLLKNTVCLIWCSLTAAQDAEPTIPIMLFWEDVEYQQLIYPKIDIQRFAGRQIEGFIDITHFAWVRSLLSLMKARSTGLFVKIMTKTNQLKMHMTLT